MFLSFVKKSPASKKHGLLEESPKVDRSSKTNSTEDVITESSRSTVQTTAGPLLSSSRFNSILDASTFANVNSPGFTSRVVNCATSGSSHHHENSATHQSRYSSVGLFPRVQLGRQSTLPTLSPRNSQKVGRTPVRVRIASPSLHECRRHSISGGPSEAVADKPLLLKRSPSLSITAEKVTCTGSAENDSSTVESSQELSRKRMFSECQDPCDEAKKRRRKAELPIPNPNNDMYRYRHVRVPAVPSSPPPSDMSSQGKRAREKSSPEEQKRQRRKTCSFNNAIFSSLSSSRNLLERLTAQKRKSVDFSRSSSPLPSLTGKQVKESKTAMDVKATQCNLDFVSQELRTTQNLHELDSSPISSRVINRRNNSNLKEALEKPLEKTSNKSDRTSKCDYTTMLFRKDVSSHSPRTSTSKTQKQSPWVQAPAADELTYSLLSDDSRVDRPERLKSLLACVSGKVDGKNQEIKAFSPSSAISGATKEANVPKPVILLPAITSSSSTLKALSPTGGSLSTALTVTVSSTCTIMTSATVTSVNGVPSSESGRSPPQRSVPSLPVQSLLPSSQLTPTVTAFETGVARVGSTEAGQSALSVNIVSTPSSVKLPSSTPNPALLNNLQAGKNVIANEQLSKSDGAKEGGVSNPVSASPMSQTVVSKPNFNSFTMKSPVNSSQIAIGTDQAPKLAFQFGIASCTATTSAVTTFGFSSSVQPSSASVPVAGSLPQPAIGPSMVKPVPTFGSTLSATKTFSFGSDGSASSEAPASALNVLKTSSGSETSVMPKSSSYFGSSVGGSISSSSSSNPGSQFGSSGIGVVSKTTFQFGASGASENTCTAPKPAPQFGMIGSSNSSSSGPTKSLLQFGSNNTESTETSKPAFQFGSSSNGTSNPVKSTFQSKSSDSSSSDTSKSMLQFGSTFQSTASAQKPALSFGSSSGGMNSMSQSPFQSGTHNRSLSNSSKSAFQLANISNVSAPPKPFQFASNVDNANDSGKSPFQFGSSQIKPHSTSNFQVGSSLNSPNELSKANFQFSASSNSTPTFGSSSREPGSALGQVVPSNSKGSFTFGSCNAVNSGSENKGIFFGSSTPNSGTALSTMFASGTSSSAFGAHSSTTQSTTFGAASNTKPSEFGSTSNFGGTGPSVFSFNSNGPSTAGNINNSFQFGSSTTNGGNVSSFSFGQKQDQTPAGLSFNATVTTVPGSVTQPPQASGLFSIGSGPSMAQRRTTTARRRR